jgi:predicted ATPase
MVAMAKRTVDPFLRSVTLDRASIEERGAYPFALPAFANLDRLDLHPRVTFIIGENGSGKSTLVEALAVVSGFNPEGGSRNFNFSTFDSHSALARHLKPVRGTRRLRDGYFLRAESYYNVASNIEQLDAEANRSPYQSSTPIIDSYGGVSLHEQSHGESFFALFLNRLGGEGLYLFDEPEAALSPTRQLAFIARLHQLVERDSQFIIATHSPIIMGYPDARILQLSDDGIREVQYEETEHYSITRDFLEHRESMLRILMADPEA